MRKIVSLLLSFGMIFTLAACGQSAASEKQAEIEMETEASESVSTEEQEADVSTKTLVVYFSCTGTTELVAEYITEILGADSYQIVPENPYTEADLAYYTNGRADQEQDDPDARPAISGGVANMDAYDTIILGFPIWHGQAPRIISTFLESYDFSGKTIVPFCTSHSSGVGSSADNLQSLCAESVEWRDGKRFESGVSKESVQKWIEEIGIE
ncbi:flavodoxin [bacterium 1xD8-48]|nr:flavodoxin [bacterium 1xD8-48]